MNTRKPNTRYQYEPLVTPSEWKGDEQRFAVRLKGILDDLYQKVGTLRNRPAESGGVKTVNGMEPDENGDVSVSVPVPGPLDFFPVGIMMPFFNSFDPNTAWGGTWQKIAEGLTLVQAGTNYPLGSTGGEATHMLTVDEMPSHSHTRGTMDITGTWSIIGDANNAGVDAPAKGTGAFSATNGIGSGSAVASSDWTCGTGFSFKASDAWSGKTSKVGLDKHHNNMPPYLAVNIWMRTA